MKGSTVALVVLGVAGAGVGAFFLLRRARGAETATPAKPVVATGPSTLRKATNAVSGAFDTFDQVSGAVVASRIASSVPVPAGARSALTTGAVGYTKYLTPVGQAGVVFGAVTHPVDTVKTAVAVPAKVGSAVVSGGKAVVSALKFW